MSILAFRFSRRKDGKFGPFGGKERAVKTTHLMQTCSRILDGGLSMKNKCRGKMIELYLKT